MTQPAATGRLSLLAAAFVIARRDFTAILFSRSFLFFLLGPLFPVIVGIMAGGVGQRVQNSADRPELGIVMEARDVDAVLAAHEVLKPRLGHALPRLVVLERLAPGAWVDPHEVLADNSGKVSAVLSGSLNQPILTGAAGRIADWQGPVSILAVQALGRGPQAYPTVTLSASVSAANGDHRGQLLTAQAAQTLLFLLTMLLAGMVLSNLVEEKGNKIIELLAAAIPMDAVFFGKLFAMLAVSFVGIAVWAFAGGLLMIALGGAMPDLPDPATGWPLFLVLGIVYFAMAYLLLGSVFLVIGSMASTVREVQTLSMPVTMMQLMVFFFASYAMTRPGSGVELAAAVFPLSSPFAMLARGAKESALLPHLAALGWQVLWVVVVVRAGSRLFRKRVMKSGSGGAARRRRGLLARFRPARASSASRQARPH